MKKINSIYPLILTAVLLTSCSKKTEKYTESNADVAAEQTAAAASADAADEVLEVDTQPQTAQKPDQILSTAVNEAERSRQMLREAGVDFSAKDVVKTGLSIDKMVFEAGGFVEKKNIGFEVIDRREQKLSDGKIRVFEKVAPHADMIVRVPSDRAAQFVNQLLPLMHFLNSQQYSAKRYELKLLEEKINLTHSTATGTRNRQLDEISRLTEKETQDRLRFSTIQLRFDQPVQVREHLDINLTAVSHMQAESFWLRAWNGIVYGWKFVLDLLVVLVTIWPIYLLGLSGWLIYRMVQKFLVQHKNNKL